MAVCQTCLHLGASPSYKSFPGGSYVVFLRAKRAKIRHRYPQVDLCTMVTPPNANIFGIFCHNVMCTFCFYKENKSKDACQTLFSSKPLENASAKVFKGDALRRFGRPPESLLEPFNMLLDAFVFKKKCSKDASGASATLQRAPVDAYSSSRTF